jgi:endonuclease/exonuclease/phosphatase family metal-dependent hydrolase
MARRQAAGDWLAPAAAMTTLLLIELLRVWLPSVTLVFGRAGTTPATTMGLFAATWFVIPLLAVPLLRRAPTALVFGVAGLTACFLRLALQLTSGGDAQLWVASLGVSAGLLALTALAAGAASGHVARVGVLAGLLLQAVVHLGLGTLDLAWRPGWTSFALVVVLTGGAGLLILRATTAPGWAPQAAAGVRGPAWPWLVVGPGVALVTIVSAAPARLELATGLTPGPVAALLVASHLAGLAVALLGSGWRPARSGSVGAAVLLGGTIVALEPTGPAAAVALLGLPVGLGAIVGATGVAPGASSPGRRAAAMAGSWVLFLLIGFLYYAAYDVSLGFPNRVLLIVAAAGVAMLGLFAGVRPLASAPRRDLRTTVGGAVALTLVAATIAGVGATHNLAPLSAPDDGHDGTVSLVLANVQMGYDVAGRHVPAAQAGVLDGLDPDVVVLNEVDRGWLLTGGHDNLRLLRSGLALPNVVFSPAADEVWGNAVLSRLPVTHQHSARLPRGDAPMARSLVSAVLDLGDGGELAVIGTHLHHVEDEPEIRLRQARAVAGEVARLRDRDMAVVLLGDLNAEPGAPELEPLEELLDHALPGGNPTWPAWRPEVQIDHVLVSDDLEVGATEVTSETVSDHLFVSVEVARR